MGSIGDEKQLAVKQLRQLICEADSALQASFEIMAAGFPDQTLERFLKAREWSVPKAHKMLIDCLHWRIKHEVDTILTRPIEGEKYEKIRASQLYGLTGFDRQGRPVLVVRVGLSYSDPDVKLEEYVHSHIQHNEYRDRVLLPEISKKLGRPITKCIKIYDMAGLKLSHLSRMKMQRAIAGVDDLNYPEKAEVYYVVNPPTVFNACWKAVKPMLQERTRQKVQVLKGSGRPELLQLMDEDVLPHFVNFAPTEGLGSLKHLATLNSHPALADPRQNCCSSSHPYHDEMQFYIIAERRKAKASGIPRGASSREVGVEDVLDPREETKLENVRSKVEEILALEGGIKVEGKLARS